MSFAQGWLKGVRHLKSPNFNQRPNSEAPSVLVIHNISLPPGCYGGGQVEDFFLNCLDHDAHPFFDEIRALEVSSHFFIKRCGEIIQFVSCLDRAWHAGESNFSGRSNCNDFSIGIELEGQDSEGFCEAQYQSLARLTKAIQEEFPQICKSRITGHSDIAPERKTDPGPHFDWERYFCDL